jgi:hypothetical protein
MFALRPSDMDEIFVTLEVESAELKAAIARIRIDGAWDG